MYGETDILVDNVVTDVVVSKKRGLGAAIFGFIITILVLIIVLAFVAWLIQTYGAEKVLWGSFVILLILLILAWLFSLAR
jgi:lysylphosphatidylglycerol synthetase-like protein (DUF2156 family)